MYYRKEQITLPKDFPFDFFEVGGCNSWNKPVLHFHDCLELNYIVEGRGINYIENQEYTLIPNDFYVINNLEHHMAASSDGSLKMKVIVFDPKVIWNNNPFDYDYLKPFYSRNVFFSNRISFNNSSASELLYLFKKIENEWTTRQEGYKIVIKGLLTELLAILYRHFKTNNSLGECMVSFHKAYDRIRDVLDYINSEPETDFTIDNLAAIAHMNRTYFSTYFKDVMNITVFNYIKNVRINHSMILLKTSNYSITEIAMQCGFKSLSHFNKAFKEQAHVSPTEFRMENRTRDK